MSSVIRQIAKKVIPFRIRVYWIGNASTNKNHCQKISDKFALEHNTQENMNAFFSDTKKVDIYLGQNRLRFYNELIDLLITNNILYDGKDIVDVGCGTGHLLLYIRNRYFPLSLTGFDYSESALSVAKRVLPEAHFTILDIYDKVDHQYDIVFCIEVLEHLLYPDKALKNLLGMLKPSGVLLITVPNGRIDTYEGHINYWSPESWEIFIKNMCTDFIVETGKIGIHANFALVRKLPQ